MSNFSEFFENMVNGGGYNRSANGKGFKISGKFGKFSPVKSIIISALITVVLAFIVFYFTLPALNFSNEQFYSFIIFHLIVFFLLYFLLSKKPDGEAGRAKKRLKVPVIVFLCIALVFAGGWIASAEIFNSSRYRDLITVEDGNFSEDVNEITFEQIPVLDKASAEKLGDRKLGELADMVSQFEVASDYIQINYKNRPVRVTPLEYGDLIKWFNNRSEGLPAYLMIDMVTQNVEVIRLEEGMKYSMSEHFGRYLMRHLRFSYPTFMFDTPTFEIDDDGNPYWICPKVVKRIGLFGGKDIDGAVIMNAVTGESEYYEMEEIPTWVDRVLNGDLIMEQYDYHGEYINGFWNSIFGQKGVTRTTEGYNYIAMNDDIYVYTGITSVGSDQSNIGFILVNQRTKDAKYYAIPGATETSAMLSAEGVVQHLKYDATFPLLLNIAGEPTYFISLKDNAGLVKQYAMVNVERYQIVATGSTIEQCERTYERMLEEQAGETIDGTDDGNVEADRKTITGTIEDIRTAVRDGNTYYYIKLTEGDSYYSISASDNENVVIMDVGDRVDIEYYSGDGGQIINMASIREVEE